MGILVSDFDGTLTQFDFFDLVRRRWPIPPESDPWDQYVAGKLTHFEALAEIFSGIRATEGELDELVNAMQLDAGLSDSLRVLAEHGWEVIVASAGCDWYIRRLLRAARVSIPVYANPGEFDSATGLRMTLPESSPFFKQSTGVDKVKIVKNALAHSAYVAFAGDGRPDLEPALLVEPSLRFARGWLAQALDERGEAYQPFDRWSEIAEELSKISC